MPKNRVSNRALGPQAVEVVQGASEQTLRTQEGQGSIPGRGRGSGRGRGRGRGTGSSTGSLTMDTQPDRLFQFTEVSLVLLQLFCLL
jgi:hypothetical protein